MTKHRGAGEGSIYKRKDGRWAGAYTVSGKRHTVYAPTRREVAALLTAALTARENGAICSAGTTTVEQFLEQWLRDRVRPRLRYHSVLAYELDIRRLIPHLGAVRLAALRAQHIDAAEAALLRQFSPTRVHRIHACLHVALKQAVVWRLISANPADAVKPPRPEKREMRTLSPTDVRLFFETTRADPLYPLWVLLITTGLRIGEALALRWEDLAIDDGKNELVVRHTLVRRAYEGFSLDDVKSAASRRRLFLAASACAALREHRTQQRINRLAAGPLWKPNDLVFCRDLGEPLYPSTTGQRFHAALERAGLPPMRPHDLRHTAITLLLNDGAVLKLVSEMAGHSSVAITMSVYQHVGEDLHREVATRMDRLLHEVS